MNIEKSCKIRYAQSCDKEFWFSLDKHLSEAEFSVKVRDKQAYVLFVANIPAGILRYNLFWDNTPFCTLLYIAENFQNSGYGKMLMNFWEDEMRAKGYDLLLVSTQADETAQYFYRAIGYCDCGSLLLPKQSTELFLCKEL